MDLPVLGVSRKCVTFAVWLLSLIVTRFEDRAHSSAYQDSLFMTDSVISYLWSTRTPLEPWLSPVTSAHAQLRLLHNVTFCGFSLYLLLVSASCGPRLSISRFSS